MTVLNVFFLTFALTCTMYIHFGPCEISFVQLYSTFRRKDEIYLIRVKLFSVDNTNCVYGFNFKFNSPTVKLLDSMLKFIKFCCIIPTYKCIVYNIHGEW